tara:strand:- start:609 stop:1883 length:1275 start_codon:yes stop_codon:yes gene_type:complete
LYFFQGVPWAFIAVAFVTYLVGLETIDVSDDQIATLTLMGTLPWMFGKLILGPLIDRYQSSSMGRRRPWILGAQLGMIVTMAAFLAIDAPEENLQAIGLFFLVHNIFAALQDVSSDALAVDVLEENEISFANGIMFVSKGFGFMFAALVLGGVLLESGFQAALMVQLPVLALFMLVPLFVLEKQGDRRFPGPRQDASVEEFESLSFGEIWGSLMLAFKNKTARWALLLSSVVWIGGGMGASMGIIDIQFPFLFQRGLGWSEEEYLALKGVVIFLMTMIGFFIGGMLGSKFGSHKIMTYAVGLGTVMTIVWSLLRANWTNPDFMQFYWMLWTIVWGVVGANLIALLMSVTTSDLGGSQFSVYMTGINFGAILGTQVSPAVFDLVGENYPNLFLVGAGFQVIVLLVLIGMGKSMVPVEDSTPTESK